MLYTNLISALFKLSGIFQFLISAYAAYANTAFNPSSCATEQFQNERYIAVFANGYAIKMTVPNALYLDCPSCGENSVHEVLKGKMGKKQDTLEATVKCQECGHTYTTVVRETESVKVPIIVSERKESHKDEIELMEDEILSVGDEIFLGENQLLVTAIDSKGRRVQSCEPAEISTIWAKKFDKVILKISINKHTKTIPAELEALPDEEFFVGDLMTIGKERVAIHSIKTNSGIVRNGGVSARDIVRIYTKAVRMTYS